MGVWWQVFGNQTVAEVQAVLDEVQMPGVKFRVGMLQHTHTHKHTLAHPNTSAHFAACVSVCESAVLFASVWQPAAKKIKNRKIMQQKKL